MTHPLPSFTRFGVRTLSLFMLLLGASLLAQAQSNATPAIRYVRTSGTNTTPATATTWATSTTNLQGAIDASGAGDQVWVATGMYKPTTTTGPDSRTISFAMKNGVAIYGGFSATDSPTSLSARNPGSFTTVLSGDIGTAGNIADNSFHVVSNPNRLTSTAVLDGFIITGGNANGSNFQSSGGGISNGTSNPDGSTPPPSEASSPTLRNCIVQNNSAISGGGGMVNFSGNPTLTNCSFQNNSASQSGGGLANFSGNPTLTNCSFQNNSAPNGGGIANVGGNVSLTNCVLFGNGGANTLIGISAVAITARYSLFDASVRGYTDGNNNLTTTTSPFVSTTSTQLNGNAPAIDAGLNSATGLTGITTDLAGNPRFFNNGQVDMGAYEYQAVPPVSLPIRYVKVGGAGTGSGDSWADASGDLQSQIEVRGAQQVWVATGTYKPGPANNTDRGSSFAMKNGVAIYGGFSATDSPSSLSARNPGSFTTVLSGDIGTAGNIADNSFHVISNPNRLTNTAVLDGFIITGGAAAGSVNNTIDPQLSIGGGILNGKFNPNGSVPTGSEASSPTLRNCIVQNNSAAQAGGGMANIGGNPTLTNCSFQNNSAQAGGGMANFSGNPTLTNCSFQNNSAPNGGGIANNTGNVSLTNCVLFGNGGASIISSGGTITVRYSLLELTPGPPQPTYTDGGNNLTTNTSPFVSTTSTQLKPRSQAIDAGLNSATGLAGITTDLAGNPRFFNGQVDMGAYEYRADLLPIRYVKVGGAGTGSGDSWANASGDLQAMIDASSQQVWVATGTYRPTTTTGPDSRTISFGMTNGVTIYGGFAATGNPSSLTARNPGSFTTVLSGDIGTAGNTADNSYHVISNPNRLTNTAVLDGFIITGGNANGSNIFQSFGGGISNGTSNPDGSVPTGSEASSPTLRNCIVQNNSAAQFGGGMANIGGNPTLTNCSFQSNSAQAGGGMVNFSGNPTLTNCSFQNNSAPNGGGIANSTGNVSLTNCVLFGNGGATTLFGTSGGTITVRYSLLELTPGPQSGYTDGGNNLTTSTSPFVSTTSTQLNGNASAIDVGLNSAPGLAGITTDLAGNPRFFNSTVDMGAYEYQAAPVTALSLTLTANPNRILTMGTTTLSATVSGGTTPYSYTFSGPGTISQMPISNTATVSGLSAGVQTFTVVVRDVTMPSSQTISGTVSMTVSQANTAPVATSNDNQTATVGVAFSYTVNAFSDPEGQPLTYSASLSPANGFVFNPATRTITGTPSVSGVSSVTVTATDPGSLSASTTFTITVSPAPVVVTPLSLSLTASPMMLLTSGTTTLSATVSGGTTGSPDRPYSYTFSGPGTITPSGNTASVSGLSAGVQTFMVVVRDATMPASQTISGTVNVTVTEANTAPVATANPNQTATVGMAFSYAVNAFSDPEGQPLTYSASISPANGFVFDAATRLISGTPGMSGVSSVTVTATDPGSLSASTTFTITVNPAPVTPTAPFAITGVTTIDCTPVANRINLNFNPRYAGLNGQTISLRVLNELSATTAAGPYTLQLYPDNPTITLKAIQSGSAGEATFSYNWLAACNSLSMTGGNTPPTVANAIPPQSATVNQAFSYPIPANTFTDAETPNQLTLSVSGLPPGLSFTAPATISGTPTSAAGSPYSVNVTATDPGNLSVSTTFTITVSPAASMTTASPFSITGVTTIDCTPVANRFSINFTPRYAGLNGQTIRFQVLNELSPTTAPGPYSLTLYPDNPLITLKAIQSGTGGETTFSYNWLAACNSLSMVSPTNTAPTTTGIANQSGTVNQGYSLNVASSFSDAQTPTQLSYSATGLPAGLSLMGSVISGTPSLSGMSNVTVTATDPGSLSVATSFTLTVSPAASMTSTGTFAITGVTTVSCQPVGNQINLTFTPQYSGLNDQPITFRVLNELSPTSAPGPYTLRLYTDNPTIILKAIQSGTAGEASFNYNWLAACNSSTNARLGAEPGSVLSVVVLGNPVAGERVEVEVRGGAGQSLRLQVVSEQGYRVDEQGVEQAGGVERFRLRVGPSAGVYLLRVSSPFQSQTLKLLKK